MVTGQGGKIRFPNIHKKSVSLHAKNFIFNFRVSFGLKGFNQEYKKTIYNEEF